MATRMWRKLKSALFKGFSTAVRATIKNKSSQKMNGKAWNLLINVLKGLLAISRSSVHAASNSCLYSYRSWALTDAIGADVDSEFLLNSDYFLLSDIIVGRSRTSLSFHVTAATLAFLKQGNVVRFSVGVVLRKATYVYVTAVYQGAILYGCWEEMGRGEKRNNIFLSSPPSPSSLPLLTNQRCGNLFLSKIFLWFRNSRRCLNIPRRKYGACYF